MSRTSFDKLCNELRPFIQETHMRSPVSVAKQVALTLYYLADKGRLRKLQMHLVSLGLVSLLSSEESHMSLLPT